MRSNDILAAALALPEEERRDLVEQLAASLPLAEDPSDVEGDPAFLADLDRREAALASGAAQTVPGEVVFAELHAKLARARASG